MDNFLVNSFLPPLARGSGPLAKSLSLANPVLNAFCTRQLRTICAKCCWVMAGVRRSGELIPLQHCIPLLQHSMLPPSPISHRRHHSDNWRFGAVLPSIWTVSLISRVSLEDWPGPDVVCVGAPAAWRGLGTNNTRGIIQLQNYNVCNVIMHAVTPLSGGHCGHCQVRADKLTIVMQLPNNPVTPHHQHPQFWKLLLKTHYEWIVGM